MNIMNINSKKAPEKVDKNIYKMYNIKYDIFYVRGVL